MLLCQRLSYYIEKSKFFAQLGAISSKFVFFCVFFPLCPACLCLCLGIVILLVLLSLTCTSGIGLCFQHLTQTSALNMCSLQILFLESLEMYYAVVGFLLFNFSSFQKLMYTHLCIFLHNFFSLDTVQVSRTPSDPWWHIPYFKVYSCNNFCCKFEYQTVGIFHGIYTRQWSLI